MDAQIPTKIEMTEMFSRLENAIKLEIYTLRVDLGQLLKRVEETEVGTDIQAQELGKLNEQVKTMQADQRKIL